MSGAPELRTWVCHRRHVVGHTEIGRDEIIGATLEFVRL
jgi:hypothetical protein